VCVCVCANEKPRAPRHLRDAQNNPLFKLGRVAHFSRLRGGEF